jgi:hypothetical protein
VTVPDRVIRDLFAMAALMRIGREVSNEKAAAECYRQADACMKARTVDAGADRGLRRASDTDHEHVHMREEP